ncbi:hypothetical protein U1Q18_037196 [Sarracenia purpurea var. burkii]
MCCWALMGQDMGCSSLHPNETPLYCELRDLGRLLSLMKPFRFQGSNGSGSMKNHLSIVRACGPRKARTQQSSLIQELIVKKEGRHCEMEGKIPETRSELGCALGFAKNRSETNRSFI